MSTCIFAIHIPRTYPFYYSYSGGSSPTRYYNLRTLWLPKFYILLSWRAVWIVSFYEFKIVHYLIKWIHFGVLHARFVLNTLTCERHVRRFEIANESWFMPHRLCDSAEWRWVVFHIIVYGPGFQRSFSISRDFWSPESQPNILYSPQVNGWISFDSEFRHKSITSIMVIRKG